jgi:hypothetical protein
MPTLPTIARIWRGRTRRDVADAYEAYLRVHGIPPLEKTALDVQLLHIASRSSALPRARTSPTGCVRSEKCRWTKPLARKSIVSLLRAPLFTFVAGITRQFGSGICFGPHSINLLAIYATVRRT